MKEEVKAECLYYVSYIRTQPTISLMDHFQLTDTLKGGHPNLRTIKFSLGNSGQTLIKKLSKSGQVNSSHSVQRTLFSAQTDLFSLFSLQLADTINIFQAILAAREEDYKCCQMFFKCYLFQTFKNFILKLFFAVSYFLVSHWTIFSWP